MSMTSPSPLPEQPAASGRRKFATTRWSLIRQAGQAHHAPARAALEELCQAYWLPVYGFMRRQTRDVHEAQDWTQGFFASLLARDVFADLNPDLGRFRSFLLAAARNYASNERDRLMAARRGGQVVLRSLNYEDGERQLESELTRGETPEHIFERRWALALLDRVLNQLAEESAKKAHADLSRELLSLLSEPSSETTLTGLAERFQLSPEAVRVSLHRMRKRYRQLLRQEIAETVDDPAAVDDEIQCLFAILRRG